MGSSLYVLCPVSVRISVDTERMSVTFFDKVEIEMTVLIRKSNQSQWMNFKSSKYKNICA